MMNPSQNLISYSFDLYAFVSHPLLLVPFWGNHHIKRLPLSQRVMIKEIQILHPIILVQNSRPIFRIWRIKSLNRPYYHLHIWRSFLIIKRANLLLDSKSIPDSESRIEVFFNNFVYRICLQCVKIARFTDNFWKFRVKGLFFWLFLNLGFWFDLVFDWNRFANNRIWGSSVIKYKWSDFGSWDSQKFYLIIVIHEGWDKVLATWQFINIWYWVSFIIFDCHIH